MKTDNNPTPAARSGSAWLTLALALAGVATLAAQDLDPGVLPGWRTYVAATEGRRTHEANDRRRFLALDFTTDAGADRQRLLAGQPVVRRVDPPASIKIRSAQVHHWRGAIFVPGVSVDELVASLRRFPPPQADVLQARVLSRDADTMTVYLRLRRSRIITVVYDTEHRVTFEHLGPGRAASTSVATRIVELDAPGTDHERPLGPDDDHDFLWRLQAYWRYEATTGGVIAECESLALSRPVPFGLGVIAGPIINGTARDSMEAALRAVAALGR